jgi:hypothetical protein
VFVRWSLLVALVLIPFPLSLLGGFMNTRVLLVAAGAVLAALIVDQMFGVSSLLS